MQYGRRAFGPQRRMSEATIARNIADSIKTHKALGIERTVEHYTKDEVIKQRVAQLLAA